jgi:release factor glutamine methyltransferase
VLIPRPETERLVQIVLEELRGDPGPPPLLLDVGCGTGAIALALKAELPAATVWGSDIDARAVALARSNAASLGLDVTFRLSDLLSDPDVARVAANCTAMVSNPPYLPASDAGQLPPELKAEPDAALFGGNDGLAVARRLLDQAAQLLPAGALLALELDPRNVAQLQGRLLAWRSVRVEADLTGRQRFLVARR